MQINGAFGVDFTRDVKDAKTAEECLRKVGVGLLSHGEQPYRRNFNFNDNKS